MPRTRLPASSASLQRERRGASQSPSHISSRTNIEIPGFSTTTITNKGGKTDRASTGQCDPTPSDVSSRMPLAVNPQGGGRDSDADSTFSSYSPPPSAFGPMDTPNFDRHISDFQRYIWRDFPWHDTPLPNAKSEESFEESPTVLLQAKPGSTGLAVAETFPEPSQRQREAPRPSGSEENFELPPMVTRRRALKFTKELSSSSPELPPVPKSSTGPSFSKPSLSWGLSPQLEQSPPFLRREAKRPGKTRRFFSPLVASPVQWGGTDSEDAGGSDSAGEDGSLNSRTLLPSEPLSLLRPWPQDSPVQYGKTSLSTVLEGSESAASASRCSDGCSFQGEQSPWKRSMSDSLLSFIRHEEGFAAEEESMRT